MASARLWRILVLARIRSEWQYRASFFALSASSFLFSATDFVAVILVFEQVPVIADWSIAEVAFLYGTGVTAAAIADAFVGAIESVPDRIRLGTFDRLLVRPAPALLQIVADDFALRRFAKVLQSGGVLAVAIVAVDVEWNVLRALTIPLMIATGSALFIAIWIVANSIAFWFTDTREAANSVTYGGSYLSQYPLAVYGRWFRRLFAVAVPISFVNYLPALYVLQRPTDLGFAPWMRFLSPVVAILALLVAWQVWSAGIRHYRSTGS